MVLIKSDGKGMVLHRDR